MTGLRLKKIPDSTPVRITLSLPPEVHADLLIYADIYRRQHGCAETPQILAAQMIATFIQGDNGFRKAKQSLLDERAPNNGTSKESVRGAGTAT